MKGPLTKWDKMYVCKEDTSNKYWGYALGVNTHSADCWWGRLGTDGTITPKAFPDSWKLDRFIMSKTDEKLNEGYKEVTPEEFELQSSIAKELGVGSKIDDMRLVSEAGGVLKNLTPKELHSPGIKPKVYAKVVGRRSAGDDTIPVTEFLFDVATSYKIKCKYRTLNDITIANTDPIHPGDDCEKLANAVGAVIGKVLL